MNIINFDNSATTFPKPVEVRRIVKWATENCGGNAGRGGHSLAMITSEWVYRTRQKIAEFFGGEAENVVFTVNCTHALNFAIHGLLKKGDHVIISCLEHNSVSRPVEAMARKGLIRYDIAEVFAEPENTVQSFRNLIRPDTKAIICTVASNVTGQILPYREIGQLCREKGICFIADGAQACGIIPVKLSDGINILCTAGHKGLYGIMGTGLLITDGKYPLEPIIEGGTGTTSLELEQPDFLPESLESGTLNTVGILSLYAGTDFVERLTTERIYNHEMKICNRFIELILTIPHLIIYRNPYADYVPIVAFNIEGMTSEEVADYLNRKGFCLRAGYQCAGLAHKWLGTTDGGTLRLSPSVFSNEHQAEQLAGVIRGLVRGNSFNP